MKLMVYYRELFHLKYYPFMICLDKFNEICNTLTKISGRICVPNKTEDENLGVFIFDNTKN